MKKWNIIILFLFLATSCSNGGEPGGDGSGSGGNGGGSGGGSSVPGVVVPPVNKIPECGSGNGSPGCSAVNNVLKWLTKDKYKAMAPLTYPGGIAMGGQLSYIQCRGAGNDVSDPNTPFYTYEAFMGALKQFPEMFINTTPGKEGQVANDEQQKKIIVAALANWAKETNGSWGPDWDPHGVLCWVGETGYYDKNPPTGCAYDAAPNGYCFNGRGPVQLTWSYNYKPFSQHYFGNDAAYQDPRIISANAKVAFASAFWFFTNYIKDNAAWRGKGKGLAQYMMSPRKYNNTKRDFAYTVFLVNGGIECANTWHEGPAHRAKAYRAFYKVIFGSDTDETDDQLLCMDMQDSKNDEAMANAPLW